MPNSKALFVVPDDASKLADIIEEQGGLIEYERDLDDVAGYLSERAGEILTVEFEDHDDPSLPLYTLAQELQAKRAAFLGASDSYEERSRGDRYEGYVVYNLTGLPSDLVQRNYPWREGEPNLDERSLKIAGISDAAISKVFETLLPQPPESGMKR